MASPSVAVFKTMSIFAAAAAITLGCVATATAGDERQIWRCNSLFDRVDHYEFDGFNHRDNGIRLRSTVGQYLCQSGNTAMGMSMLEREAHNALLPVSTDK